MNSGFYRAGRPQTKNKVEASILVGGFNPPPWVGKIKELIVEKGEGEARIRVTPSPPPRRGEGRIIMKGIKGDSYLEPIPPLPRVAIRAAIRLSARYRITGGGVWSNK